MWMRKWDWVREENKLNVNTCISTNKSDQNYAESKKGKLM